MIAAAGENLGEVLFEIHAIGNSAKVCALHVATNTEVSVICPANLHRSSMQQAALRKLRFVLEKQASEGRR